MKRTSRTHRQAGRSSSKAVRCEPLEQRNLLAAPPLVAQFEGINIDQQLIANGGLIGATDAAHPSSAVGPYHIVSATYSTIQWHTKGGVPQVLKRLGRNNTGSSTGSFFETLAPNTVVVSPEVIFDQHANRFVVMGLDRTLVSSGSPANTSRLLVAVSDDADPNGTWYFQAIDSKITVPFLGDYFADAPGLAASAEAIYITADLRNYSNLQFYGPRLWILHKTGWYTGGAPVVTSHDPFENEPFTPKISMQPTHMFGSSPLLNGGPIGILVGTRHELSSFPGVETLTFFAVRNPTTAPSIVRINVWDVADIDDPLQALPGAPQPGFSGLIPTGKKRIESAVYRDGFLWSCSTVVPGSGPDAGKAAAHWYKSDFLSPVVPLRTADHGSISGQTLAPGTHTFFPSIMVDALGNMAMTFSASGPGIFPGAYYTSRLSTDAPGTVQPPATIAAGLDAYEQTTTEPDNLWGESSAISIDPSDNTSFWMYNDYALTRLAPPATLHGRWGTRHARISHVGSISGKVFLDLNANGIFDAGDQPMTGRTVYVDFNSDGALSAGEPSVITPVEGTYSFGNLVAGTYKIRQAPHPEIFTTNAPQSVVVSGGGVTSNVNLANVVTVYTDFGANTNYLLRANVGASKLEILVNGTLYFTLPTNVPSLAFNLGGGDDSLTIDHVNGSPVPAGGVFFDGGVGTDSLIVTGSALFDSFALSGNSVMQSVGGTVSYSGAESLSLNTAGGQDTVNVVSVAAGTSATVNSGDSVDAVNVYDTFTGLLTVSGGAGFDQLTLNGSPLEDTFTVAANSLQNGAAVISIPATDIESLVLNGNGGNTNFYIGSAAPGAALTLNGGNETDFAYLGTLDPADYPAPVTFNAAGGEDILQLNDWASPGAQFFVSPTQVTKSNGFTLNYGGVEQMYIEDGLASSTQSGFEVNGTSANFQLHITGGNKPDVYNVLETGASSAVWIDGSPGGDVVVVNGDHSGAARVRQGATLLSPAWLIVGSNGTLDVGPGGNRVLRTQLLSMDTTGSIDLYDNTMFVDYASGDSSPAGSVGAWLASGYAGGAWNGTGIRSTTVAGTAGRALGYAEATELFTSFPATFAGQPIDSSTVLVRYTVAGDTNLDQRVDITDLGILATSWQQPSQLWSQGNFNFDQTVDVTDLGILATNWQVSLPGPSVAKSPAATRPSSRLIDLIT